MSVWRHCFARPIACFLAIRQPRIRNRGNRAIGSLAVPDPSERRREGKEAWTSARAFEGPPSPIESPYDGEKGFCRNAGDGCRAAGAPTRDRKKNGADALESSDRRCAAVGGATGADDRGVPAAVD